MTSLLLKSNCSLHVIVGLAYVPGINHMTSILFLFFPQRKTIQNLDFFKVKIKTDIE